MNTDIVNLHKNMQSIIDCIAKKELKTANSKLETITNQIETLLDTTTDDELLIEISKYQIMATHLVQKLNKSE